MSEENSTSEVTLDESTKTETTDQAEPQGKTEIDWKSEARKWESRAKAAKTDADDAAKWREYELNSKSEQEKLADELARTKAEASEANAKLTRLEVAALKGIPAEALDLLSGSTREDLEAQADKLLSLIAEQSKPKSPLPDENQGKPTSVSLGQLTENDLKGMTPAEIMEAKKAGRLDQVLGKN
jgi:hypothetical protein